MFGDKDIKSIMAIASTYRQMVESELADGNGADPIIETEKSDKAAPPVHDKQAIEMIVKAFREMDKPEHDGLRSALAEINKFVTDSVGEQLKEKKERFHRNYRDYHTSVEELVYVLCATVQANDVADAE